MDNIYIQLGFIILLTAGSGSFMFLTRRTIIVASRLIEYDLRSDLLDTIKGQSMSFYHRNSTGSLMAHATNDIPAAREFLGPAIMYSANTITTFAFALYFMLSLDVQITLVGLIPLPFIAIATYLIGSKVHVAFRDVQDQFSTLTSQTQEAFSGVRVIRAYSREEYEREKFGEISHDYLKKYIKLSRYQAITMPLLMVLVGFAIIAVLGFGGLRVIQGHVTLGDLTQFFIYLNLLIWPVAAIGWITNIIQRASASAGRLGRLMEQKVEITDTDETDHSISRIKGMIHFENVNLKYSGSEEQVLKDISLKIPEGTSLGIIGNVGSGKSSLGNLLARLYLPTKGKIYIDGNEIEKIPLSTLRNSVSIVEQDSFLFSASILENIRFGNPDADFEKVKKAAEIVQLHDEIEKFPDKYETVLGERGISLSGGQKQRISIARALLREPKILVLDDALSAVDAETEVKIIKGLREYMKSRTTVIISHRISTLSDSDKIITMDNGRIIEEGNHDELIERKGKYAGIYAKQKLEEELSHM